MANERFWSPERCRIEGEADADHDFQAGLGPRGAYGNIAYDRGYREAWKRLTGEDIK